jgi:DNA-binding NarL/FixJ family response regulator
MKKLRILLADDHALVRAGIKALIRRLPDAEVVAEAGDGLEAIELIERTKPDIAVLDLGMPKLGGLAATERIVKEFPGVKIVILSGHQELEYVRSALRAGAVAFLGKDVSIAELGQAFQTAAMGEPYLSPALSRALVSSSIRRGEPQDTREHLTDRQREVLKLVTEGNSMKVIASILGISVKTVEAHRAQVCERLGIHDVPGLMRYAIRHGIISIEPGDAPPRDFP